MLIKRWLNQGLARLAARWPMLSEKLVASFQPLEATSIPWQPVSKPLERSKVAMVTTAGLHHKDQPPFNMEDALGDPTFRVIDGRSIGNDYAITHDYYDHRDADQDVNIIFPIARLNEMLAAGCIGALAEKHFSFMGHIDGHHVQRLVHHTAPQVVQSLKKMQVDAVLLTPA